MPVLVVRVGDSNQHRGGHGWHNGVEFALLQRGDRGFTPFATGLSSLRVGRGAGGADSYMSSGSANANQTGTTSLDGAEALGAPFDAYWPTPAGYSAVPPVAPATGNFLPHYPGGLPNTAAENTYNSLQGIALGPAKCPWINRGDDIRFLFTYGKFASGGGTIRMKARRWDSPYTNLLLNASIACTAGSDTIVDDYFDFAASLNPSRYGLEFMWNNSVGTPMAGKMWGMWQQAVSKTQIGGFCVSSLLGMGGQSFYDNAVCLDAMFSSGALGRYIKQLRRAVQVMHPSISNPRILFCINGGVNDTVETGNAIGGVYTNSSALGVKANLESITTSLGTACSAEGIDNVKFMFERSHCQSDTPGGAGTFDIAENKIIDYYNNAMKVIVDANPGSMCAMDLASYASQAVLTALGYYANATTDRYHLNSAAAYQDLCMRAWSTDILGGPLPTASPLKTRLLLLNQARFA